jgi:tRNA A-37 threonylcarbamoyl transferase component Bud32
MLFFTIGSIGSGVFEGIEYIGAISGLLATLVIWWMGGTAKKDKAGNNGSAQDPSSDKPSASSKEKSESLARRSPVKLVIVWSFAVYIVIVASANLLIGNYAGEELEQISAALIILLILWLIGNSRKGDFKKAFRFQMPEAVRKVFVSEPGQVKQRPVKPRRVKVKYPFIDEVAEDLRATAKRFEDPYIEHFFTLGDLQIRRSTKSQEFTANAVFRIARNGFNIQFVNVNSRTGKVREIDKKWKQTIGVTENRFELYLQDHSMIEFIPETVKSRLYLSAFWQVFNDALNGSDLLMQNPIESGLGHKLREVANYIVEHRETVGVDGAFDLSKVESKVSDEEFSGYQVAKFPEVRDKIQGWRLLSPLGAGAFGQVFKAENVDTGELCAIKLMSPLGQNKKKLDVLGPEFRFNRESFLAEAPLSMKVSSPFIASAIDAGKEPWPWIRYPLVQGVDVFKAWNESKDKQSFWWNLAHDLVSALNTIHSEGMVHKDVKPNNMLKTEECFVLLDFGVGEVAGYGDVLGEGIAGTRGFIAPEIYIDESRKTRNSDKTDIFAAGVTLIALRDPSVVASLASASASSQAMQQLVSKPIDLSSWPPDMAKLLNKMVNFVPSERASASSLLKDIAPHVDLDSKLELIEKNREAQFAFDPKEHDMGTDESFGWEIDAPISSWAPIESAITRVVEEVKPRFFVIELGLTGPEEMVYVQAISGGGGWILEAMSDNFSKEKHTRETKANFVRLGWTPPSKSEPNYIVNSAEYRTPELVRRLVDAFEFGYPIRLNQIVRISIDGQGKGKY